jgi:hypothetical protein
MNLTIAGFAFWALASALSLQAQTATPQPGPEHKKLNVWLGDWTYEKETYATPLGPAGKSSGRMTGKSVLDGFFVQVSGERTGTTGAFSWFEIWAFDAIQKKYTWTGYGSDGDINSGTAIFDSRTMNYFGTVLLGKEQYGIRGTIVLASDSMGMVEDREISLNGQKWMPYSRSKFVKSK